MQAICADNNKVIYFTLRNICEEQPTFNARYMALLHLQSYVKNIFDT